MNIRKITPISFKKLVKVFELDGFRVKRQKGDHISMVKPGIKRPLIIKTSPRDVPVLHIRTNMTTAGMSRERYFQLLDKTK
jgi:predicted RNA binding protein YcfA (HicA-like mRNA interferase family)